MEHVHNYNLLNVLIASDYNKVSEHIKLWNRKIVSSYEYIYVRLPEGHTNHFDLLSISVLDNTNQAEYVLDLSDVRLENIWVIIPLNGLKLDCGNYTIKIECSDTWSGMYSYFASFMIQDDDPDRPYVYMQNA